VKSLLLAYLVSAYIWMYTCSSQYKAVNTLLGREREHSDVVIHHQNVHQESLASGICFNYVFDTRFCSTLDNAVWVANSQRFIGRKTERCKSFSGGIYLTMTSLRISCAQIGIKKKTKTQQGRGQTVTSIASWGEIKFQTEIGWQLAKITISSAT